MLNPTHAILRAIALAAAVAMLAGCGEPQAKLARPSALAVTTVTVEQQPSYRARRAYSGQVEAARESALGFEVGGKLERVDVGEGDRVRAGEALAVLDTARLSAAAGQARARLDEARAQAVLAAATLQRVTAARGYDGVSAQEVDQARESADRAAAAQSAAEAALAAIRIDIEKSTLRAPYDAWVIRRSADEGQVVAPGVPVLEIQEVSELEVRIGVAGDSLDHIKVGQQRSLGINGVPVDATVTAIIPRRNSRTRSVDVLFRLDGAAPARVGDIARLSIEQEITASGFWLPIDALTEGDRGIWIAYAVAPISNGETQQAARDTGATHRLESRPLEILHEEAERVFARGALTDGDRIVDNGLHRAVAGQLVRLAPPSVEADVSGVARND